MHTYSQDYEAKLKAAEDAIDSGEHIYKEYFDLLPEYLQQKYIQKCSENPHYQVDEWVYTAFTEKQRLTFHKQLLEYNEDIQDEIVKLLPEYVRDKWMKKLMANLDYIPDNLAQFISKEKNADIIKTVYKNLKNKGGYHDSLVFSLLPDEDKLDWILDIGSRAFSDSGKEWLKTFKKAHSREEIIKTIIDG